MSTLILFDLDDTLLVTDAKIGLVDSETGETVHLLSTNEFRDWKSQGKTQGFEYDFGDFTDVDKVTRSFLNATPAKGLAILRDAADDPDAEIGILTARSSEKAVQAALPKFLIKQGVDIQIDPQFIFAVNDPKYTFEGDTDSERKLHVILKLIKERIFDSILLIDDDPQHKQVIDEYCHKNHIKDVEVYSLI